MITLTPQQQNWIDQDNPQSRINGNPLSVILVAILASVNSGTIGITADARDINQAASAGLPRWDVDTYPGSSLTFGWTAGRMSIGPSVVAITAGSLALAASNVNYVESDKTGTVSANTASFTAGRCPLFIVTAGSATFLAVNVVSAEAALSLIGLGSVTGAMLTAPGATKEIPSQLGASIAATTTFDVICPGIAGTLVGAVFANSTAFATSDTDYWTFALASASAAPMLAAGAASTTKTTGGSLLAADIARSLALHGVPGTDANLTVAANDVVKFTLTKTGAPAALTLSTLRLDFSFAS